MLHVFCNSLYIWPFVWQYGATEDACEGIKERGKTIAAACQVRSIPHCNHAPMRYPSRRIGGNNCAVLNIILVWVRLQLLRGDPDSF